jgi:hypothetical protein
MCSLLERPDREKGSNGNPVEMRGPVHPSIAGYLERDIQGITFSKSKRR